MTRTRASKRPRAAAPSATDLPARGQRRGKSRGEMVPPDARAATLEADLDGEPQGDDVGDDVEAFALGAETALVSDDGFDSELGVDGTNLPLETPGVTALAPYGEASRAEDVPGGSLVRYDPLTAYVNEIRRYPLLSREEEHALAVRLHDHGDLDAARRLITANLRLVVKIAHEYRKAYRNLLDLVQEGNIGLMQAVRKFDPYKGVKLSSYAAWWIRAYILKFVLNNWRLVKIGTTQAQRKLFFKLKQEKERLAALGIEVDAKRIAEELDVKESEVIEMERRLAAPDLSLDTPLPQDSDGKEGKSRLDLLASSNVPVDERMAAEQLRAQLRAALEKFSTGLEGKELTIFQERLLNENPLTLQEIGDRYGISRERARQIEKRMLTRLRRYLSQELGEAVAVLPGGAGGDGPGLDADDDAGE